MESAPSAGHFDSLRARYHAINAERPTVIFFTGLQGTDGSGKQFEEPGIVFKNSHQTKLKRMQENCTVGCDEYDTENEEVYEENPQGGRTYFQSNESPNSKPRQRTSFTKLQRNRLEEEFSRDAYIIGMKRWRLSVELNVPEKKIKIWFQNRRTKMKKGY